MLADSISAATWVQLVASVLALGQAAYQFGRFLWRKFNGRLASAARFLTPGRVLAAVMVGLWVGLVYLNGFGAKLVLTSLIVVLFIVSQIVEYRATRAVSAEAGSVGEPPYVDAAPDRPVMPTTDDPSHDDSESPLESNESWVDAKPAESVFSYRQSGHRIDLRLRPIPQLGFAVSLRCEVEAPNEKLTWLTPADWGTHDLSAVAHYPFEDSPPLIDGVYIVRWRRVGGFFGLMMGAGTVKQGQFEIRGGQLVR